MKIKQKRFPLTALCRRVMRRLEKLAQEWHGDLRAMGRQPDGQ
jgi:hypothetical protein